jgi:predicted metallopeptidase
VGLFAQYKLSTLANTTVESWYHATEIILDLIITFNKMVATTVEHWPLYTIPMLRPRPLNCAEKLRVRLGMCMDDTFVKVRGSEMAFRT